MKPPSGAASLFSGRLYSRQVESKELPDHGHCNEADVGLLGAECPG